MTESPSTADHVRVAIVGSGFAGLGMAIRLTQEGIDDFAVLERADDLGGTWRDNSYPGCACDIPSYLYSFSFAPNPDWTHAFSGQEEIWQYLRDCSDRYGVTPKIRFRHEVTGAVWDSDRQRWLIDTAGGSLTADVLVVGSGPLSEPAVPDLPGLSTFTGTVFHSARWDHGHDLTGERVAVIGTGASAIQFVPKIAQRLGALHLFQRTPAWVMPRPDRRVSAVRKRLNARFPVLQQAVRARMYWLRELLVFGLVKNPDLMRFPQAVAEKHLSRQVADPALRARLTPTYRLGCKRILVSNDFYPSLTRSNVELVTDGIAEIRPTSVVTVDGTEREVDTIIFGTGFHVTDISVADRLAGRGGQRLSAVWNRSPQAYLGTSVPGFPNMFLLVGPNAGGGHTSIIFMIESQLAYVLDCLRLMATRNVGSVELRPEALAAFNRRMQDDMRGTVWTSGGCSSWYLDATGLNTTLWPGFTWTFRKLTRRFDPAPYELRPPVPAREPVGA